MNIRSQRSAKLWYAI